MRYARVYRRKNKLYFHSNAKTTLGHWIATAPFLSVEESEPPSKIVSCLKEVLESPEEVVDHPKKWGNLMGPMLKLAGERAYSTFAKSAASCDIKLEGDELRFIPTRNTAPRQGYQFLWDKTIITSYDKPAEELVHALARAFEACEQEIEPKSSPKARIIIKTGDVFSAKVDDEHKKYFQYVALDATQLNSQVIRVFKKTYLIDEKPALEDVIKDEIDFYAHVVVKWGIKRNLWEKVGKMPDVGQVDVVFRGSSDCGNPQVKVSHNWSIWKINEPSVYVGKLEGENQEAEIGYVMPPLSIVHRMRTGKY